MERLSLRESISKRWTTLKTKVFGGPSFECIDNYILLVIGLKSIVIEAVVSWPFQVCMMSLKGHSQLCDRADLDITFVSFEKSLPQPEIK